MNEPSRQDLVDVLERMGIDVSEFDNLRIDSYEHTLARYSLEELELFYTVLRKPGKTLDEKIPDCPPWPPGTRRDGEAPGRSALAAILQRINSSDVLDAIGGAVKFTENLKAKMLAAGMPNQDNVLDSVIDLIGQEVIAAKLGGGQAISNNLDPVDRLMMRADSKGRAELEKAKLAVRERAEARSMEKLKFERRKWMGVTVEKVLDEALRKKAEEIAATNMPKAEQIELLGKALFQEDWED